MCTEMTSAGLGADAPNSTNGVVKWLNVHRNRTRIRTWLTGRRDDIVIRRICCQMPAPSMAEASYRSRGIPCKRRALPVPDEEQGELLEADQDPEEHRDEVDKELQQQGRQQEQIGQAALADPVDDAGRTRLGSRLAPPAGPLAGGGRVAVDTDRHKAA